MKSRLFRNLGIAFVLIITSLTAVTLDASPASAAPLPVTVTITKISHIGSDIDPGLTQGPVGDFYAGVSIEGVRQNNFANRLNFPLDPGTGFIFPFDITPPAATWTFTRTVDDAAGTVPVRIELWDNDDCDTAFCTDPGLFQNADDRVDVSPSGAKETLDLVVNRSDATWSGDVASPANCASGTGGEAVEVCFEINTVSTSGDADGDSLLDGWEQHGFNADGDATIDANLPALGTDPRRKDLFVEVDCMVADGNGNGFNAAELIDHSQCPLQAAMNDVVQSFANAPVVNVDSSVGVQLHLDTGTLYGPGIITVNGTGGVAGTFGDLGSGGSQITEAGNTVIDWDGATGRPATNFFTLKTANFNALRAQVFRYGIFAHQTNFATATNDCTSGWAEAIRGNDFIVSLGGGEDLNANGTVDRACWGATPADTIDNDADGAVDEDPQNNIDDDGDCVAGTDTNGDGVACGFRDVGVDEDGGHSIGTQTEQAGTFMHELGHVIGFGHGGGDNINNKPNYLSAMNYLFQMCSVPTSPPAAAAPIPGGCDYSRAVANLNESSLDECFGINPTFGFGSNDWNGNGVLEGASCPPPNTTNVSFNINGDTTPAGAPIISALPGFNDWANIFFPFQTLATFTNGVTNPPLDEADPADIDQARRNLSQLTAPQIAVTVDVTPGNPGTLTVNAVNNGRGPAFDVQLTITTPGGNTHEFELGDLVVNQSATRTIEIFIPSDEKLCRKHSTLTIKGEVSFNDLAGVRQTATLQIPVSQPDTEAPELRVRAWPDKLHRANHKLRKIHVDLDVRDKCDHHPEVRLVSITSNEPDSGLGPKDRPVDIQHADFGSDDRVFGLRAERDRHGEGRIYRIVYEATDASDNTSQATTYVSVPARRNR